MIMTFRSMSWAAIALATVLGCYTVSLKVSGERKAVDDLRSAIARDVRGIRTLQAELRTRARLPELQRWNDEVLALGAPTAAQFVRDPVLLAGYEDRSVEPAAAPRPGPRYAIAPATPPSAAPPVVTVAYSAPRSAPTLPAVTAALGLDDAVTGAVNGATLERVSLR